VVIANINRNILLEDMATYVATMKDSAMLMLSGFMAPDVEPLVAAGRALGLERSGLMEEGEWRVLSLRR
jgi:ribosomal protein L11 methyltransferase